MMSSSQSGFRTLYLPFYVDMPSLRFRTMAGIWERQQKKGLYKALLDLGPVNMVDYRRIIKKSGRTGFLDFMRQLSASFQPNLILAQIHGADLLQPEDLKYLRRELPGTVWVNWVGDYQDFGLLTPADIEIVSYFDLQLVVAFDNVKDYEQRGVKSRYWQVGWEPDGVGHEPHFFTPRHDLLFMANRVRFYPGRQALVARVRGLPINFGLYGQLWPWFWAKGSCLWNYKQGCRLLRAAKLVLADNPRPHARGYVSNRLFQSLAAGGALVLMQYFHDYETLGLQDGEHLVIWRDFDDLEAKIAYWLRPEQEEERRAIVATGQQLCLERHSFPVRVQELREFLAELA